MKKFETPMFTVDTVEDVKLEISKGINAPVVRVHHTTLEGGAENIVITILFFLDVSDTCKNNVLVNSRHSSHYLLPETHKLEQFIWDMPKEMDNIELKTIKDVIKVINDYIESVK